jgi:hypothetical protein
MRLLWGLMFCMSTLVCISIIILSYYENIETKTFNDGIKQTVCRITNVSYDPIRRVCYAYMHSDDDIRPWMECSYRKCYWDCYVATFNITTCNQSTQVEVRTPTNETQPTAVDCWSHSEILSTRPIPVRSNILLYLIVIPIPVMIFSAIRLDLSFQEQELPMNV